MAGEGQGAGEVRVLGRCMVRYRGMGLGRGGGSEVGWD